MIMMSKKDWDKIIKRQKKEVKKLKQEPFKGQKKRIAIQKGHSLTFKRARTYDEKKEIIERLFKLWLKVPEQRLGQLICNYAPSGDLFFPEDYDLMDALERNVAKATKRV